MTAPEREALVKALRSTSNCEPGCLGRCVVCPDTLMREAADLIDALSAAPAVTVTEGWKLVPIEPTEAMLEAMNNTPWVVDVAWRGDTKITTEHRNWRYVIDGWSAMLAAVPTTPQTGSQE